MRWFLSAEQRVANGATALDASVSCWQNGVDPDVLDITDGGDCVLGQLYGHYGVGINHLNVDPVMHGFFAGKLHRAIGIVTSFTAGIGLTITANGAIFQSLSLLTAGVALSGLSLLGIHLAKRLYDTDCAALEAHWIIAITERRIAALIVPVAVQDAHGDFVNDGGGNIQVRN